MRLETTNPMIITDTPLASFDKVAMDIVGSLPPTEKGNTYILTMQDLLTKYSITTPLSNIRAEAIAEALVENFICKFGCPKAILTDKGRNLIGHLMQSLTKAFRIQHFKTTRVSPAE